MSIPWRSIVLIVVGVPSIILSAVLISLLFLDGEPYDWWTWERAASLAFSDQLYTWSSSPYGADQPYAFRYSPLYAAVMVPFSWLGLGVWRVLHVLVLALLPWRVALLTLAFAPFWYDVLHGNVMAFILVAAFLAIRGNRWGTIAFFVLFLLVPRPLMLPVAAWIVWQRPEWRLPALGFALVGAVTLLYPGYLAAIASTTAFAMRDIVWPPPFMAVAWIPIGLVLGAWLTWNGRLGLASLAVSPYVIPYYLVMGLLEARKR